MTPISSSAFIKSCCCCSGSVVISASSLAPEEIPWCPTLTSWLPAIDVIIRSPLKSISSPVEAEAALCMVSPSREKSACVHENDNDDRSSPPLVLLYCHLNPMMSIPSHFLLVCTATLCFVWCPNSECERMNSFPDVLQYMCTIGEQTQNVYKSNIFQFWWSSNFF